MTFNFSGQLGPYILKEELSRINFKNREQNIPLLIILFLTVERLIQHLEHSCGLYTRYFMDNMPLLPEACSFLLLANEKMKVLSMSVV